MYEQGEEGQKGDAAEGGDGAVAPTPRFDELARRFRSHEAIARKSKEGRAPIALSDLYLDPVAEDFSKGEGESFFSSDSMHGPGPDLPSNPAAGLRDSSTSLPVPAQAPQRPSPSTTVAGAVKPRESSSNPWGNGKGGGADSRGG